MRKVVLTFATVVLLYAIAVGAAPRAPQTSVPAAVGESRGPVNRREIRSEKL
jgi:hypothetical protein